MSLDRIHSVQANPSGGMGVLGEAHTPILETEITGEITNDEVLGEIFSRFCLGK